MVINLVKSINMRIHTKTLSLYALVIFSVLSSGCSSLGVEPWERNILAKKEMLLNSSPIDSSLDDHIYFSKESSSGGKSFAGGGCGCN